MWPLISSARISRACASASSSVSANFTPPAFMRPPVSTCDLMTTGPPMRSAIWRASAGSGEDPYGGAGGDPVVGDWDSRPRDHLAGFVFEEPHGGRGAYPDNSLTGGERYGSIV